MRTAFALVLLFVASLASSLAQTDPIIVLLRGSYSVQTSSEAPSISYYSFLGETLFSTAQSNLTVTLIRPVSSTSFRLYSGGEYILEDDYTTRAAFDIAYPAGTYRVQLGGSRDDSYTLNVSAPLPDPSYITNFPAAQAIPNGQGFTLTWAPYAGGTTQDSILVTIDADDGSFSYDNASSGNSGNLSGTATQLTLSNLPPNKSFTGTISLMKFSQGNLTNITSPLLAYSTAFTEFSLHTVAAGPAITTQPASQYVSPGAGVLFFVQATTSGGTLRYQWKKDGTAISGATTASYYLPSSSAGNMGFYSVTVSDNTASVESNIATLTVNAGSSRLTGLSTRGYVPAGGSLTPGFYLRGSGSKSIIVRAVGPSLSNYGVTNPLSDPRMDLIVAGGSMPLLSNDDWGFNANLPALRAAMPFPLAEGSKDAAALVTLSTTTNFGYTVRIVPSGAATSGIAMAEVYDLEATTASVQFFSLSTLGFTGPGDNVLTPGFFITGTGSKQLLIRAVGPTLGAAPYNVPGVLADPQFVVIPLGQSFAVAGNDNWGDTAALKAAFVQTNDFALLTGSKDAAAIVRLPPGGYTIQATGVGGTTGNVLVEVYDMDPAPTTSGSSSSGAIQAAAQIQSPNMPGGSSAPTPAPTPTPTPPATVTPLIDPSSPPVLAAGS